MTYPRDPNTPSGDANQGYQGYPGGSYPASPPVGGYPGYPAAPPTGRTRGTRAVQVGAILMAAGIVLLVVGGILANTGAYNKVNGFQRVKVSDHTGTITFKHTGGYLAYYESDEVTDSTNQKIPLIPVRLTDQATKQTLTLTTPYGNRSDGKVKYLHYDHDGHKGLAMWQFHIDQAGTYDVQLGDNTRADSDAQVAFGKSIAKGVVVGGVLVIVGVLILLAGLIVLIIGFVKQRRHKRQLREGAGGGVYGAYGQPAGWPQSPPQQGWPSGGQSPQAPGQQPTQQWPAPPSDSQQGWPPPPDQQR